MNYNWQNNYWFIPEVLYQSSLEEMAIDGKKGNEGICLWLGNREENINRISHLILLRGEGIIKGSGNITLKPELMLEVHRAAQKEELILIGQIHSHSRLAGIDLSWTDRKYGVSVEGYLSVVAPNFAKDNTPINKCGVHVYVKGNDYVRFSEKEIKKRMIIEPKTKFKKWIISNP